MATEGMVQPERGQSTYYTFMPKQPQPDDIKFEVELSDWECSHFDNLTLPVHKIDKGYAYDDTELVDVLVNKIVDALWASERNEAAIFFSGVVRTLKAKRVHNPTISFLATCGVLEELTIPPESTSE